ncbi:PLP-dependent transferase [Auricularia subglabra TFB-10046 SS5]|nr:PLP-dependent transferase [Auricularia subglabra TFB-10046 SS5]
MSSTELPKAIDLTHHLSDLARARESTPLLGLVKYWGKPGVVSLAGGFPHQDYFPFASLGGKVLAADSFPLAVPAADPQTTAQFNLDGALKLQDVAIDKAQGDIKLAEALQYALVMGLAPLRNWIKDFTARVYQPAYADWATFVHAGNTDAWSIAVDTLLNPGEGYFTEEFSYPSAQATAVPHHVRPVPIQMDAQGMRADDLRVVCEGWDEKARGMKRPRVLYTVPVGQNPCGTTLSVQRKKDIYDVCVEYDIIIVEDDPYYFLQIDPYALPPSRNGSRSEEQDDAETFLGRLTPTFLNFDYQGRVIRFDSFSKTIAPGARLGWYTFSPSFYEKFKLQAETSTQNPNGFGQALVTDLLVNQWGPGIDGYLRWLRGIRAQYTLRRDFAVDCFAQTFHLVERQDAGATVLVGSASVGSKALFEFVPPVGGMMIWLKLRLENHPASANGVLSEDQVDKLEREIWEDLAESGLLLTPGWYFNAAALKGKGHFRMSYSYVEAADMRKGVETFARVIKRVFGA